MTINDKGVKFSNLSAFKAEIDKAYIANDKDQSLTDAQKVQALNNLIGKEYAPSSFSGFGKKVFAKNILTVNGVLKNVLTSSFFQDGNGNDLTNTVFVIQYDFTLGENISLPANSVLQFDGGSISGAYTLTGSNTSINAGMKKIFGTDITLSGTWNVNLGYPEWFGCYADDPTIDATPVILKMINAGMHIEFGIGKWYLSECLINHEKVVIRGKSRGLSRPTCFEPFAAGQRFIIKCGGNADFSPVTDQTYNTLKCSNFEISGIHFRVPENKKLVNADQSGTYQNFAAICFDWSVRGYVDIQYYGFSPAFFMANSWEVHIEKLEVYGSLTDFDEYAIYFGKAYTNVQNSNITQIKVENIYGEAIWGHFIGCKDANIGDLFINNIEVEIAAYLRPDFVNWSTTESRSYIYNNIRTAKKYYMIELGGYNPTILNCDIQKYDNVLSHNNEYYIIADVKAIKNLCIGKLTNTNTPRVMIVGVEGISGLFKIDNVFGDIYNEGDYHSSIFTDVPQIDFSSRAYYENQDNINALNNGISIYHSNVIINIDKIREYGPGLLFNADNYWEVTSLITANRKLLRLETDVDNVERKLLSTFTSSAILDRKMKFKDASLLKITYIGKNYYLSSDSIILTYYKNGSIINTDGFALPYSDKAMTHSIDLYTGDYDYCTFKINGILSIDSVEVVAKSDDVTVQDKVIMFPSEISDDVKTIMTNYNEDDIYKQTALLYFFDKIGNIKNKLNHLILPIFAKDINEATYDIITGTLLLPVGGTNHLDFNNTTKRVYLSQDTDVTDYRQTNYILYNETDNFEGALSIISAVDGCTNMMYGTSVYLNNSGWGYFVPSTTDNRKIIGAGVISNNNNNCYIRLGDNLASDKITSYETLISGWNRINPIFGSKIPTDNTTGTRIFVSSDQQLTAAEARTLRDAVIALDNKYFA